MFAGYTKKVVEKKLQGVMPISEGKQPVSYNGFSYLCKVLMTLILKGMLRPWKISIFGWSFETMSWNILGRCSNVHSLMLEHIDWAEDCLMVCIPSHKGDKSGTSISQVSWSLWKCEICKGGVTSLSAVLSLNCRRSMFTPIRLIKLYVLTCPWVC